MMGWLGGAAHARLSHTVGGERKSEAVYSLAGRFGIVIAETRMKICRTDRKPDMIVFGTKGTNRGRRSCDSSGPATNVQYSEPGSLPGLLEEEK